MFDIGFQDRYLLANLIPTMYIPHDHISFDKNSGT